MWAGCWFYWNRVRVRAPIYIQRKIGQSGNLYILDTFGKFRKLRQWRFLKEGNGTEAVPGNDEEVDRAVGDTGNGKGGLIWEMTVPYPLSRPVTNLPQLHRIDEQNITS